MQLPSLSFIFCVAQSYFSNVVKNLTLRYIENIESKINQYFFQKIR